VIRDVILASGSVTNSENIIDHFKGSRKSHVAAVGTNNI